MDGTTPEAKERLKNLRGRPNAFLSFTWLPLGRGFYGWSYWNLSDYERAKVLELTEAAFENPASGP